MEGATGLGSFDGVKVRRCHRRFRRCHRRRDGVIEGFDGAIEGATVSYRRCHRRCDGAWRFRRCHRRFDGACRFRRCHGRCGGVIEGFDGVIEASSGVRVSPQVREPGRTRSELTSHENFPQPPQLIKACFPLWPCRFRRVCVAFSSCCGAFVGACVCLVSRVSPCWFLRRLFEGSPSLLVHRR